MTLSAVSRSEDAGGSVNDEVPAESEPEGFARRHRSTLTVVAAGTITAIWLGIGPHIPPAPRLALLAVTLAGHVATVITLRKHPGRSTRWGGDLGAVLIVGGLLVALAVALPSTGSNDLWAYSMQGRILSVHHVNPYFNWPMKFPDDPAVYRVSSGWRHTPNPYGPVFAIIEGGVALVAGTSALATRLLFQLVGALAVAATAIVLVKRRVGTDGIAFFLLCPAILTAVNGAHNDLLMAGAVLAAVVCADRRRFVRAGVWLAVAALIKVTALAAIPAIVLWLVVHRRFRSAVTFSATSLAVFVAGYGIFGGPKALATVAASAERASRAAVFSSPRQHLVDSARHSGATLHTAAISVGHVVTVATIACTAVALAFTWWRCRKPDSSRTYVVPTLTTLVCMLIYVLPWYAIWGIPTGALAPRSRGSAAAWWVASAYLVAYNVPAGIKLEGFSIGLSRATMPVAAILLAVAFVVPWRKIPVVNSRLVGRAAASGDAAT
ncbi:MAG: DUF2029 domain-containing protein [Actinobacteria bacterium]|nr:DUF2029 domain-containing protein [Actinomycetota bacterium]